MNLHDSQIKNTHILVALVLISAMVLGGCGGSDDPPAPATGDTPQEDDGGTPRLLRIHPHKGNCSLMGTDLCLLLENKGGETTRVFEDSINGFSYEWGHQYVLQTREQGGTFELVQLVEDQPVDPGHEFQIDLASSAVMDLGTCLFALQSEFSFSSATPELCARFSAELKADDEIEGRFAFTGIAADPIRLLSIDPSANTDWETVAHVRASAECPEAAFSVQPDGQFDYDACGKEITGTMVKADIEQLDQTVQSLLDSDLTEKTCQPGSATASKLFVSTSNDNTYIVVHRASEQTCMRGDPDLAQTLDAQMETLRAIYVEPAPTPMPKPTPVPVPEAVN